MMFIVRTEAGRVPPLDVRMARLTPTLLPDSAGWVDFFCLGDAAAAQAAGWQVVPLHDGWYADDLGGGVAIWGQGQFWEVRDTPFSVRQACGPADTHSINVAPAEEATTVNVRQVLFRGQ